MSSTFTKRDYFVTVYLILKRSVLLVIKTSRSHVINSPGIIFIKCAGLLERLVEKYYLIVKNNTN